MASNRTNSRNWRPPYPQNEICCRTYSAKDGQYSISCNIITDLKNSNPRKVWDSYCFIMILRGRGIYTDHDGRTYDLMPGAFTHHFPGLYHNLERFSDDVVECSITFSANLSECLLQSGLIMPLPSVFYLKNYDDIIESFERLNVSLQNTLEADLPLVVADALSLIASIRRRALNREKSELQEKIELAQLYLAKDLNKRAALDEIARKLNLSYPHFRRIFKQATGESPGMFRIRKKIEHAKLMIGSEEYGLGEIAELLGYSDAFAFSKQFKKITGMSPREFGKNNRERLN